MAWRRVRDHRAECRGGRVVAAGLVCYNAGGVSGVTRGRGIGVAARDEAAQGLASDITGSIIP